MRDLQKIEELLSEMNERQKKALELQEEVADLTRKKFEITDQQVKESIQLQRTAVERQARITRFLVPVMVILLVYLVYLNFG